ncbi:MAG: hypothetical protein ACI3ZC_05165, partial [Candidatus Cryptobacteroides sp.]
LYVSLLADFTVFVLSDYKPSFGWSWGLKSGQGLAVSIGLPMYIPVWINMPSYERRTDKPVLPMPKILFTFEF